MKNVMDQFKLTGRRALVTGGSKGLGKVMATALAQAGADVAVASRSLAESQAAADEIKKGEHSIDGYNIERSLNKHKPDLMKLHYAGLKEHRKEHKL